MRRWIPRLILSLALGVLTTIAVAWSIAVWLDRPDRSGAKVTHLLLFDSERDVRWYIGRVEAIGTTAYIVRGFAGSTFHESIWGTVRPLPDLQPPRWVKRTAIDAVPDLTTNGTARRYRAVGWPWRVLYTVQGSAFSVNGPVFPAQVGPSTGGIVLREHPTLAPEFPVVLPCLPIDGAFASSSILYALPWLIVLALITGVRRAVRARRGRCPRCAYDLRSDLAHGCPECGWKRRDISPGQASAEPTPPSSTSPTH